MTIGTSHFMSFEAAMRYYAAYEGITRMTPKNRAYMRDIVQHKLDAGEIHMGRPEVKAGERVSINEEGRYLLHQAA